MTNTKELVERFSRFIDFKKSRYSSETLQMLTEIKGIVEQREKTEIPLPVDRVGINEINTQPMPPGDDLVEKLLSVGLDSLNETQIGIRTPDEARRRGKAEIRKLLQAKPTVDIKRLAHLLYLSIPLLSYSFEGRKVVGKPHYGDTTKAFEKRLKDELGEPK